MTHHKVTCERRLKEIRINKEVYKVRKITRKTENEESRKELYNDVKITQ